MDQLKSNVASLSLQIVLAEAEGFSCRNHEKDREDPRVLRAEHQWDEEIGDQTDLPGLPEGTDWPSQLPRRRGLLPAGGSELHHFPFPFAASGPWGRASAPAAGSVRAPRGHVGWKHCCGPFLLGEASVEVGVPENTSKSHSSRAPSSSVAEGEGGAGATGVPLGALPARPDAQCGHLEGGLCGWGVDGIAAMPPELPATMETPHVRLCVQCRGHEPQAPGRGQGAHGAGSQLCPTAVSCNSPRLGLRR